METPEQRSLRWFHYGMNDKERIDYLMEKVEKLTKENSELRQLLDLVRK